MGAARKYFAMHAALFALLHVGPSRRFLPWTLWALIMGLLAIIPYLGTFVVWGPTAAILALQGEWGKAAILVGWGAIAIGLIVAMTVGPWWGSAASTSSGCSSWR